MSNEKMSDSAKLQFCYGIILLVTSFLRFAVFVCSIWLSAIVDVRFAYLAFFSFVFFLFAIIDAVSNLIKAGKYMAEDEEE